ncbi:SDR family NAD(P)-dependent oxidoreductase [Leucobacter triazinivorans]|uniref:Glucose 1-dehydrogenase n=1 Tax=Leucobacter triazinivorans TaxID=1784719 RepID=A0A4P6KFU0_9MICO|nr:glucose 1-dehydrogenase [Leucobacter triazinivorans]QBE49053.1 glucose 1-dehydrogenase [Leucobacter triazinivorans]
MDYAGLEGKVAIVTGGTGGIGEAIVDRLIRSGTRVVIVGTNAERARALAANYGEQAIGVAADVSTEAGVAVYMSAALEAFGSVDLHVLNAGIAGTPGQLIADASVAEWDQVMGVNVRGPFLGIQAALREYSKTGATGSIVVMASIASLRGAADLLAYTASKHAVAGLVEGAAVHAGPVGVRVNAVAPGLIPTPLFGEAGMENMRQRASTSPLRRAGEPDEIATATAFLLSDDASYITGTLLSVDGGSSVQNNCRYGGGAGLWDPSEIDAPLLESFGRLD